jgi:hypothetical protein
VYEGRRYGERWGAKMAGKWRQGKGEINFVWAVTVINGQRSGISCQADGREGAVSGRGMRTGQKEMVRAATNSTGENGAKSSRSLFTDLPGGFRKKRQKNETNCFAFYLPCKWRGKCLRINIIGA